MKQTILILTVLLVIHFTSCKNIEYSIVNTQSEEGESEKLYISESIIDAENLKDTLFYFRVDFLGDSTIFKSKDSLNLGFYFDCRKYDTAFAIRKGYRSTENIIKFDTSFVNKSSNFHFTNFNENILGRSSETSFSFIDDIYQNPATSIIQTDENSLKGFIELFKHEIFTDKRNDSRVIINSEFHLDGYFSKISMIVQKE